MCALVALAVPVYYAVQIHETLSPFGTLVTWTTVCVSIFGILTVLVSFVRGFIRPVLVSGLRRPRKRNL